MSGIMQTLMPRRIAPLFVGRKMEGKCMFRASLECYVVTDAGEMINKSMPMHPTRSVSTITKGRRRIVNLCDIGEVDV